MINSSLARMVLASFEETKFPRTIAERFDILELLAESKLGETYLACDIDTGDYFVLKSFFQANQMTSESELLTGLSHKGLPMFEPEIWHGDIVYTLRQYVDGTSLEDYLSEHGVLTNDEATRMLIELCETVSVLHSQPTPIIHRDIKPSNIIVSGGDIKLIDFGISRKYNELSLKDTTVFVTPEYAPPEQYGFAQTDARTDIYSIGIVLRKMLTGTTSHAAVISNNNLHKIMKKCTALDPNNRFQSIDSLIKALSKSKKPKSITILCMASVFLFFVTLIWGGYLYARQSTQAAEAPDYENYEPQKILYTLLYYEPDTPSDEYSYLPNETQYIFMEIEPEIELENGTQIYVYRNPFDLSYIPAEIGNVCANTNQPPYTFPFAAMGTDPNVYSFIEPMVEAAVRRTLEVDSSVPITYGMLEAITVIRIFGMYPSHLTLDLMYEPNAYVLQEGNILRLDDFRAMPNLRFLDLTKQPIYDLSPLIANQKLSHIRLQRTHVSDISMLIHLPELHELYLTNNLITDWSIIEYMRSLRTLRIIGHNTSIQSIADLGDITLLNVLDVSNNDAFVCLQGFDNRARLTHLDIRNTGVTDFSPLNNPGLAPRMQHLLISPHMERYLHTLSRNDIEVIVGDDF